MTQFPAEQWLIIEDNLSIHTSRQVQLGLLAWPELQVQFIPKYACWLNLIEPWWKQLRSLALKGRRFETLDELIASLQDALVSGTNINDHIARRKYPKSSPGPLGRDAPRVESYYYICLARVLLRLRMPKFQG